MFDDALVESGKRHVLGGKRLSLPVAIGLHAAVIAAFVGASAWSTGEPPEPPTPVPIFVPPIARVTELPGGSHGPAPPPVRHTTDHHPAVTAPPVRIPDVMPDLPTSSETAVTGPESRVPEDGGGTEIGDPESDQPIGGGGGGGREEILQPGGDVRAPVLLERVEPDYPEAARRAHLEGVVILEAVITTAGDVQEVRVLKAVNPLLDEAAVRAVRRWRYRAATLNGRAVPVYLTVTVKFGLPG
ncbi:MAG TPA: TonB family protein [Thermoanaerobaculia bacterium]|jgi:protein TonB